MLISDWSTLTEARWLVMDVWTLNAAVSVCAYKMIFLVKCTMYIVSNDSKRFLIQRSDWYNNVLVQNDSWFKCLLIRNRLLYWFMVLVTG